MAAKNQRPGWLGQVPGHFNGGVNDISKALCIGQELLGNTDYYYGTGYGADGEPDLGPAANAYQMPPSAPEMMPSWAYSTTNWRDAGSKKGGGDPHPGGKG